MKNMILAFSTIVVTFISALSFAADRFNTELVFDQVFFLERYHTADPRISCNKNPYTCRAQDPGFSLKSSDGKWYQAYIFRGTGWNPFGQRFPMIKLFPITNEGTQQLISVIESLGPNPNTASVKAGDLYLDLDDRIGTYIGPESDSASVDQKIAELIELVKSTSSESPTKLAIDEDGDITSLTKQQASKTLPCESESLSLFTNYRLQFGEFILQLSLLHCAVTDSP